MKHLPGHELRTETGTLGGNGSTARRRGMAICECGAYSATLPSNTDRRAWHRQHLAEVTP